MTEFVPWRGTCACGRVCMRYIYIYIYILWFQKPGRNQVCPRAELNPSAEVCVCVCLQILDISVSSYKKGKCKMYYELLDLI